MSSSNLRKDCVRYPSSISREKSNDKTAFCGNDEVRSGRFCKRIYRLLRGRDSREPVRVVKSLGVGYIYFDFGVKFL